MTTIMYWNIMQFGYNRFFTDEGSVKRRKVTGIGGKQPYEAAQDRLAIVMSSLRAKPPDIFVIVEVNRGINELPEGSVVEDQSSLNLLYQIRADGTLTPNGTEWALVPPLISGEGGKAEGIAVFYKSSVGGNPYLYFGGPWRWPGGPSTAGGNSAVANSTGSFGNYSHPWDEALPKRQVPNNSPFNAKQQENQLAGQYQFFQPPPMPPATPLYFPAKGYRSPFLTYFWDVSAGVGNERLIKLLSYHAPPEQTSNNANTALSAAGTAKLAQIQEMNAPGTNTNEVSVIVGDFNVSLFDTAGAGGGLAGQAYTPLTGAGYTQAITRNVAGGSIIPPSYPQKSYLITHIKRLGKSFPWNTNGYPGYGYLSEPDQFGRYDAIDNIFTKYGTGGSAANITIVNRVIGAPYTKVAAFPAHLPDPQRGHYSYATAMNNPAALPVPTPPPPPPLPPGPGGYPPKPTGKRNQFRGWDNYKKVWSTSDHMALIIDV